MPLQAGLMHENLLIPKLLPNVVVLPDPPHDVTSGVPSLNIYHPRNPVSGLNRGGTPQTEQRPSFPRQDRIGCTPLVRLCRGRYAFCGHVI